MLYDWFQDGADAKLFSIVSTPSSLWLGAMPYLRSGFGKKTISLSVESLKG